MLVRIGLAEEAKESTKPGRIGHWVLRNRLSKKFHLPPFRASEFKPPKFKSTL
jgi:hypothetical protein